MRAIALATTVLIVLAMSATQPTLAADRTVQPLVENHERASISAWIAQLERVWLGLVLPGTVQPALWTLVVLPAEEETPTRAAADSSEDEDRNGVILEDGAPF